MHHAFEEELNTAAIVKYVEIVFSTLDQAESMEMNIGWQTIYALCQTNPAYFKFMK